MNELFGIVTIKCPQCGRNFERLSPDWTYKVKKGEKIYYYCTYSCWTRALEKFSEKPPPRKVPKLKPDQRIRLVEMMEAGDQPRTIAKELGVTEQLIFYYKRKKRLEEEQNESEQA